MKKMAIFRLMFGRIFQAKYQKKLEKKRRKVSEEILGDKLLCGIKCLNENLKEKEANSLFEVFIMFYRYLLIILS